MSTVYHGSILLYSALEQVPFPVLADADRKVYHRYGLEKVLSLHRNLLYIAWMLSLVTTLAPEEVLLRSLWRFIQAYW